MTTAKKLRCGHIFHVHCLRSWLERQNTCPTCRALVLPPETGTTAAGGQPGLQSGVHQSGTHTLLLCNLVQYPEPNALSKTCYWWNNCNIMMSIETISKCCSYFICVKWHLLMLFHDFSASTSAPGQSSTGATGPDSTLNGNQARLQAAAAAAAIYEKSLVYPSANSSVWWALNVFVIQIYTEYS